MIRVLYICMQQMTRSVMLSSSATGEPERIAGILEKASNVEKAPSSMFAASWIQRDSISAK